MTKISEHLPWKSNRDLFKTIEEELPHGPPWMCEEITIAGDIESETVSLWMRDPLECIKALIGNPSYKESMQYAPIKVWKDMDMDERVYGEMWSANWWGRTQVSTSIKTEFVMQITICFRPACHESIERQ